MKIFTILLSQVWPAISKTIGFIGRLTAVQWILSYFGFRRSESEIGIGLGVSSGRGRTETMYELLRLTFALGRLGCYDITLYKGSPSPVTFCLGLYLSSKKLQLCYHFKKGYGTKELLIGRLLRGSLVQVIHDTEGEPIHGPGTPPSYWYPTRAMKENDYAPEHAYSIVVHRDIYVWSRWFDTSTSIICVVSQASGHEVHRGFIPSKGLTYQELIDYIDAEKQEGENNGNDL